MRIVRHAFEEPASNNSRGAGVQVQKNNGASDSSPYSPAASTRSYRGRKLVTPDPHVCIVVRTYWGHGPRGTNGLARMLKFFSGSKLRSWQVLLLVLDSQPFTELPSILKAVADSRIRVFRQRVSDDYIAKAPDGNWRPQYHDVLYQATDDAIAACAPATQWVVVTNGDNQYDPGFVATIQSAAPDVGVIAFSYYSRYQRPTAKPCERFAAAPGAPPCKDNLLRFCQTDLAANVFNWRKLRAENRTFAAMPGHGLGLNDGLLASALVAANWRVHRVADHCYVGHAPSPQLCSLEGGGAWDDRAYASFADAGGRCMAPAELRQLLAAPERLGDVEVLNITLSADRTAFLARRPGSKRRHGNSNSDSYANFACVRKRVDVSWTNTFFPAACAAPYDAPEA